MARSRSCFGAVRDCCGMVVAGLVYLLIFLAVLGLYSLSETSRLDHMLQLAVLLGLGTMAAWCHQVAMRSDPGRIPPLPAGQQVERIPYNQPQLRDGVWITSCSRCNVSGTCAG